MLMLMKKSVRRLVLLALPLAVLLAGCPKEEQQVSYYTSGGKITLVSTTYAATGAEGVTEEDTLGPQECFRATAWVRMNNSVGWDLGTMENITRFCVRDGAFTVQPYSLITTGSGHWGWAWKGVQQYTVYPCAQSDCLIVRIEGEFCLPDYAGWCKTPWIQWTIDPDDPWGANMRAGGN